MPRHPKPKSLRQNRERHDAGTVVALAVASQVPPAPSGLLPEIEEAWGVFWADPLARTIRQAADMMSLKRLFWLYDRHERIARSTRRRSLVKGSKGQPVANPLLRLLTPLQTQILALEDRFGLSPIARLHLGVTIGDDEDRTLDDINAELEEDELEDVDEEPDAPSDPRFRLLQHEEPAQ